MTWTLDSLLAAEKDGSLPAVYPFWGHTPRGAAPGPWALSQWWNGAPFSVEGTVYATAEHWMMSEKARVFQDATARAKILACETPKDAKAWGRRVKNFDPVRWDEIAYDVVVAGTRAKFTQNPALREFLLSTGDAILVEASPYDAIWGVGMPASDPGVRLPSRWRGRNLLGLALMQVRGELRSEVPAQQLDPLRERVLQVAEEAPSQLAAADAVLREVAQWIRDESDSAPVQLDLISVASLDRLRKLADRIERAAQ